MKPMLLIAAVALLGSATIASAQTSGSIASAPANGSTGPTNPDTRPADTSNVIRPSDSAAASTSNPANSHSNWRTSSGLNADPDNPNGAPGPNTGTRP
jgi:hypothetical protein